MDDEIEYFAAILLLKLVMGKAILVNLSENTSLALYGKGVLVSILAYIQRVFYGVKTYRFKDFHRHL